MSILTHLQGLTGLLLFCVLLFIEEAGVPLPFLPADVLLIMAGVLITNNAFSGWAFLPLACVSMTGGALVGFAWSHALGRRALNAVSTRLHAEAAVSRLGSRLEGAGPVGVLICRLLPGMRVFTNLVAGAVGVRTRTFVAGLLPSVAIWVAGFTLIGVAVGIPAAHYLTHIEHVALNAIVIVALVAVAVLALRHLSPAERVGVLLRPSRRWRSMLAAALDVLIVVTLAACVSVLLAQVLRVGPDGSVDFGLLAVGLGIIYVVSAHLGGRGTAGQSLLGISGRREQSPGRG